MLSLRVTKRDLEQACGLADKIVATWNKLRDADVDLLPDCSWTDDVRGWEATLEKLKAAEEQSKAEQLTCTGTLLGGSWYLLTNYNSTYNPLMKPSSALIWL